MATGNKKVVIYNKRMIPQEGWDQYFLDYLNEKINDTTRAAFLQPGVLSDKDIELESTADDTFSLDISNADRGVDDSGNILDLGNLDTSFYEDIPFENTNAIIYYVGFRYQEIPDDVENNPRSREPEYPWEKDMIGELGDPDSVVDNTTYIRLQLNGILESGVDHRGKSVRVWLKNPVSPNASVAYYDGVVGYSAPNNYVDIPYTATQGPLGQTTPAFPISLTASDYTAWIKCVSWFRNTDISLDGNYVFIGTVQGSGAGTTPTIFDITGQKKTFLISLDRAYRANSPDTPAPGRTIIADKYSVVVEQAATSTKQRDPANTAFTVDKLNETIDYGTAYRALASYSTSFDNTVFCLKVLSDGVGNDLQQTESVTLASGGNTVTFTRGAVDLTTFDGEFFSKGGAYIFFTSMTDESTNSVYRIKGGTVATNTLDVLDLDGTAVAFPAGQSGNATIIIPTALFGASDFLDGAYFDASTHLLAIPKSKNGLDLRMFGNPADSENCKWLSIGPQYNDNDNRFLKIFSGKLRVYGGGTANVNTTRIESIVSGTAQIAIDKRSSKELDPTWAPSESSQEHGFDYRGNDFSKAGTTDLPPYQLAGTFRIPFSDYDSGSQYILAEENFTRNTATKLQLTRASAQINNLPVNSTDGQGLLLAEVEFDTPNSADGLYITISKTAPDIVEFQRIDGTAAVFPVGTGKVRFYGGVLIGPCATPGTGFTESWSQTITAPTQRCGPLRLAHEANDTISSTDDRFLTVFINAGNIAFSTRDGGQVFARALSTKSPTSSGSGLTQWDQIVTSLLHADIVNLLEGTREILLPDAETSCDVMKRSSGVWSITRVIPVYGGIPSVSGGAPTWGSPGAAATVGLLQNTANGSYRRPFIPPQNASKIVSVTAHVYSQIGDGTVNAFGIEIYRAAKGGTTSQSMLTTGIVRANGGSGVAQDVTFTTDQNNGTVDNKTYQYYVHIEGSSPTGDILYSLHVTYETSKLGENLFDIA
jgi:hypothetical protein